MKIVNADTIQVSEKEFIDAINAELDWVSIEKMILEKHQLQLQDEVLYREGDIVVHDNQIAYKLDFDITVSMSLIFNRNGECLDIDTPDGIDDGDDDFFVDDVPQGGEDSIVNDLDGEIETEFDNELDAEIEAESEVDETTGFEDAPEFDLEGELPPFDSEDDPAQSGPEQKCWSKVAPGLAAMINDINQDS